MIEKLKILSVNISEKKGTVKVPVDSIELTFQGIKNDAHAGKWHRMVSLLGKESIEKFELKAGRSINYGEFAENITTHGFEIFKTQPLDILKNENVELMITQIGKSCHGDGCSIYREIGNCVMPKEGIFAKVLKEGILKATDELQYIPKIFKVKIITLSDRASSGEYEDKSGIRIREIIEKFFKEKNKKFSIDYSLIPDNEKLLKTEIVKTVNDKFDFLFTTGGTGIGPRDITPDTIKPMLHKELPGIMELIRYKFGSEKPGALLSRGVAGIIGETQIYTLPGSIKAVNEYMSEILKTIEHITFMIYGIDIH